jgi:NAD(P)-dependent dehydrogenase (short-subunit alcohol dehydrogenase family)
MQDTLPTDPEPIAARFPDLTGRSAIVTGASRGIGRAIAGFFGKQGMRLTLTARSEESGRAAEAELRAVGVDCQWVTADLATAQGAREVFEACLAAYDHVDVLVNNAARLRSAAFLDLDENEYRQSCELNMRIIYETSYLVAHHMADTGRGGNIIHISSVGGLRAHRGLSGYDASKGAIDALTRAMALDLAPHRIRVNAVAPGATWSSTHERRGYSKTDEPRFSTGVPLGRLGRGEDIGAACAFLASNAGSYITGQVLYVDGGITCQIAPPGMRI